MKQISTHKAVRNGNKIDIILKGIDIPVGYKYPNGDVETEGYHVADELLYSIPATDADDVHAIMERYEEDNRCNVAEMNNALKP